MGYLESYIIVMLLVGAVFGVICGRIAQRKGYSYWSYFALGFLLSAIGLIVVLIMQDKSGGNSGGSGGSSNADELLKYKQLLDAGAITQSEYDSKKKELLSSGRHFASSENGGRPVNNDGRDGAPNLIRTFSVAAVVLGVLFLLIFGGYRMLALSPVDGEYYWSIIPAFPQASLFAALSGIAFLTSKNGKRKEIAFAGGAFGGISGILCVVGFLALLYWSNEYGETIIDAVSGTFFFYLITTASAVCSLLATRIAYVNGTFSLTSLKDASFKGVLESMRGFLFRRRRPILLGVLAVALSIVGYQAVTYLSTPDEVFAVYSDSDNSLTFYRDKSIPEIGADYREKSASRVYTDIETTRYATVLSDYPECEVPWLTDDISEEVKSVRFDGAVKPISCAEWFRGMENCTSMDLTNLDTNECEDFSFMFSDCSSLIELDVSGFSTANVADFSAMFNGCSKLSEIDVSGFDTGSATTMAQMFGGCEVLGSIPLEGFDTSNVRDFSYMFAGCTWLRDADVSGFDTSSAEGMYAMFANCQYLTDINVSSFDTSNVTSFSAMFANCQSLEELDVSGFDTSSCVSFGSDTLTGMFGGCSNLRVLTGADAWNTSSGKYFNEMFIACRNLKLDCSRWDVSNVVDEDAHSDFSSFAMNVVEPNWPGTEAEEEGTSVSGGGSFAEPWTPGGTSGAGGIGPVGGNPVG